MANTYVQIGSTVTVGSGGAASIDFTSIPGTYTDLVVKASLRGTSASYWNNTLLRFNGSSSNYTQRILANADGSAVSAAVSVTSINYIYEVGASSTATTFGNAEIYIPNYTAAINKSVSIDTVTENNGTQILLGLTAGLWSDTSAITSIKLTADVAYAQYSTATLYGIKKN